MIKFSLSRQEYPAQIPVNLFCRDKLDQVTRDLLLEAFVGTWDKEKYKVYVEKNKDKIRKYHQEWYLKNKERIINTHRAWKNANRLEAMAIEKEKERRTLNNADFEFISARVERRKLVARIANLRNAHGMTIEQYDEMVLNQDGRCAICNNKTPDGKRLNIDHDHATGKVRELLCGNCNRAIGIFKDDASLLEKAITYLKKHRLDFMND